MRAFHWGRGNLYRAAIFALALISIALIVHEIFGEHGLVALRRQRKEIDSLQRQIQQLQKENQELADHVKALKSDPQAIESLAREQLRLARPGEIIYVLPEKERQEGPPAATAAAKPPPPP